MWIVNPKSFAALDLISAKFLELHPEQLPKRKKRYTYKLKKRSKYNPAIENPACQRGFAQ
jgi:hypothetical protein